MKRIENFQEQIPTQTEQIQKNRTDTGQQNDFTAAIGPRMSESAGRLVKKQKVKLEVLYENDDILIINKPKRVLSQKAKRQS